MFETRIFSEKKKFFIGDICYALKDEIYDGVWGSNDYKDGLFDTGVTDSVGSPVKFFVCSTAYGDGSYHGTNGKSFPVDAGNIGVVPVELWGSDKDEESLNKLGLVVEDSYIDAYVTEHSTFIFLGPNTEIFQIPTDDRFEDDDEDEEYYDEDEDDVIY